MSPRVSVSINYYIFICRLVIKVTFFQIMVRLHFVKICWKIGTMPRNNMNPPYSISPLWSIIRKIVAWKGATKNPKFEYNFEKKNYDSMCLCIIIQSYRIIYSAVLKSRCLALSLAKNIPIFEYVRFRYPHKLLRRVQILICLT